MNEILDILKSLLPHLPSSLVTINKIHITNNSKNKFNDKMYSYDKDSGDTVINLDKLNSSDKEKLSRLLKMSISENIPVLEEQTSNLLDKLYAYKKESKDQQILSFFKDYISLEDFEALESALYIRYRFRAEGGDDIKGLKDDIRKRFGDRGNNISNLCTAGYFEEFLMPIFNSLENKSKFKDLYEVIISTSSIAIFVHSNTEKDKILKDISDKLEISKKYGINFIHIHGIGYQNIKKIKECLQEQERFFQFFKKHIYEKNNIIIVELLLN